MAAQIRATAIFRFVNFLIGFSSWKGATPANEFQASISRETGQSAINFASSFSLENVVDRSAPAGTIDERRDVVVGIDCKRGHAASPFAASI